MARPYLGVFAAANLRINLARDCFKALAASRALANASEILSACVINSGSIGEVTTKAALLSLLEVEHHFAVANRIAHGH
jgi:hypothetical protein